ncbi:MAG: ATP-dependent DNA helicase RecG [Treponema sp.]|nr:ATP-dependent DNA helicase RecG [Treponema sp.]MCL2252391.1 ATP-dependent DNA helicase RecG [Treponema sp.]
MFLRSLSIPLKKVFKNSDASILKLSRLGIFTVADLLTHFPRKWEDRRSIVPISDFQKANVCTTVTVLAKEWIGYDQSTLKVLIEDICGTQAVLMFFNCQKRQWLVNQLTVGFQYKIYGNFKYNYREIQSSDFDFEPLENAKNFDKILPVYPLTAGLTQNKIRQLISTLLTDNLKKIENELPDEIIKKNNLMSKNDALKAIHFPSKTEDIEKAKRTLIYEELFYLELIVGKRAIERRKLKKILNGNEIIELTSLQKRLIERLPFTLTKGQKDAVLEINRDMADTCGIPMSRLLQGDVGSGKTLVAFLAALFTIEEKNGKEKGQAVIMAPTELLSRQHAENAARLLEPLGMNIAYLTGNVKAKGRKELLKNLKEGTIDIVVGTHALFSKDVEYKNLRLAVIDEQHRFGVTQRSLIMSKGNNTNLLMMSATPIPRTLALTIFGDMDVSIIKDMPEGRLPIKTHLAKASNAPVVYDYIRKELKEGRQAYFVYPLIEGNDEIKDAVSMSEKLAKEYFPEYKTALIHSKISEEIKKQTMDDFRKGEIKILAATSVVEVGVDVPNATCMIIEHAERFGLSALHQLRGRVGRGKEQSYCYLVYADDYTEDAKARLLIMKENTDGFIIAEEDLKLRGPGAIAGTEQSGFMALGIADPIRDIEELEKARKDVFEILEGDSDLLLENHRIIARVLEEAPPFNEMTSMV